MARLRPQMDMHVGCMGKGSLQLKVMDVWLYIIIGFDRIKKAKKQNESGDFQNGGCLRCSDGFYPPKAMR